jgi:hypothetical protein
MEKSSWWMNRVPSLQLQTSLTPIKNQLQPSGQVIGKSNIDCGMAKSIRRKMFYFTSRSWRPRLIAVKWREHALDQLADIYVAEPNKQRREWLVLCVQQMSALLGMDAQFLGESRGGMHRVWFCYPFVVGYTLILGGDIIIFHLERLQDNSQTLP